MQKTATVQRCCFGTNGRLAHNSEATDSICGDGVQLGDECIVKRSILEDGVVLKNGVQVDRCYIGTNVGFLRSCSGSMTVANFGEFEGCYK